MSLPKRIVLGVCGGISAYKAAYLLRLFRKAGADVRVIMTESAEDFVGPLTFSTLSGHEVLQSLTTPSGRWNNHVELAQWAQTIVIAPATCNTIAKMASGAADSLLLAVCLSARCPVILAPAMDREMWSHRTTRDNVKRLKEIGYGVLPVAEGELASGLEGEGRMLEPDEIFRAVTGQHPKSSKKNSKPLRVLITAGPTQEPIDAVRFISNRSSGKMGAALADSFASREAEVTLILGPSAVRPRHANIQIVDVSTADEMYKASQKAFARSDITIAAAAVTDFAPKKAVQGKLKKEAGLPVLSLRKTPDILMHLGRRKRRGQLLVGFALETDNEVRNARNKLKSKNLDLIILNSLNDAGAGFGHDTNKVTLVWPDNNVTNFELMLKTELADKLADLLIARHA
jgi:phosphopantothenoylcysteine decarboxylase/phosphopantothenate--cysteine ligase